MLDERVLAKIKILGKDYHDELFQLIDKKHVPQDFGGHGGPLAHLKPGWKPENFHFHIVDAQQATSLEAYKLPVTGGSAPGGVANKSFNRKASCVTAGAKESLGELQWYLLAFCRLLLQPLIVACVRCVQQTANIAEVVRWRPSLPSSSHGGRL